MISGVYSVNFKGGAALVHDIGAVNTVIMSEREVTIEKHTNVFDAYAEMVRQYEDQNYVPGGNVMEIPSEDNFRCNAWWRDRNYLAVPKGLPRQFVVFSAKPERVGYYCELDGMLVALLEEPVGTVAHEVDSYTGALNLVQKYIATNVGCFSGYFDAVTEFPMVRDLLPNCMVELPYLEWMHAHCVLPQGLQEFSRFGYAQPRLAPAGNPDPLTAAGRTEGVNKKGGENHD